MTNKLTIKIIVLSWNGAELLNKCFKSLSNQSFKDFEILLVDNGSRDDTESVYRKYASLFKIEYIRLKKNYGYAKANNIAINESLKSSNYIVLLNNDTKPTIDWLKNLVKYMESNKNIAMAQGINMITKDTIDSNGIYIEDGFIPRQRSSGAKDIDWTTPTIGPNAAGAIFRTSELNKVIYKKELLDSSFFAYVEDVDLMLRAFSRGLKHEYVKNAILYHHGSVTGNKIPYKKMYWGARNNIIMIYKNIPRKVWKIKKKKIVISQLANLEYLYKNNKKLFLAYLLGIIIGLIKLPLYLRKRRNNMLKMSIPSESFEKVLVNSSPPLSNPIKKFKAYFER